MTCKHLFKAVALALSLAVGAAPALAKNFTELKAAASPAGGAWYVGMGAMGKAISTMYPELDVSLFPGGGLANVMHVEKGASDFGIAAHSVIFAAAKGIDPFNPDALHREQGFRHYVPRPDQGKEDAHPHLHVPHRREFLSVRQVDP